MAANDNIVPFRSEKKGPYQSSRIIPARLRDARLAKGLNQSELATEICVTRQAVSAYEQGEKSPEGETMNKIATVLQQPMAYFTTEDPPLFGASSAHFFRAMGPATKRRNLKCGVYSKWFVQASRFFDNYVNYPPLDLITLSPSSSDGYYTDEEIEIAAETCRKAWGLGSGPISNIVSLLENKGIIVCRLCIPGENVEAFSFWNGTRAFIFLASEKDSCARARFDAAHELGHLILHRGIDDSELEDPVRLKIIEKEANRFASAFQLPRKSFPNEVYTTRLDAFVELKKRWKVAIQAMIYRCKDLSIFDEDQITNLYKQISARKWRTKEPLDDPSILPLEEPKLLKQAVTLLVENNKKTTDEIRTEICLNPSIIETLCNLPPNFLAVKNIEPYKPTLK